MSIIAYRGTSLRSQLRPETYWEMNSRAESCNGTRMKPLEYFGENTRRIRPRGITWSESGAESWGIMSQFHSTTLISLLKICTTRGICVKPFIHPKALLCNSVLIIFNTEFIIIECLYYYCHHSSTGKRNNKNKIREIIWWKNVNKTSKAGLNRPPFFI